MNSQEMGTSPVASSAIWSNAPWLRSIEFELVHVGQSSAIVTVTLLLLSVFVIFTCLPHRSDLAPELP